MKMFILGLDGASYDLINRLIEEDKIPNIAKIKDEGVYGKLMSTTPPHTAPGWVSAFTGVNPGKHGVYQFWHTQEPSYQGKLMGRGDWRVNPVWNILNAGEIRTGIINVPMTHPPESVDGYMISWPLSNTLRYSYPLALLREIGVKGGHIASDINCMYDGTLSYITRAIEITRKRLKTLQIMKNSNDTQLTISIFTEIDRICHFYWKYAERMQLEGNGGLQYVRESIEKIFIEVDWVIGSILEGMSNDSVLMIISDHGFGKGNLNFYVQNYLIKQGYMKVKQAAQGEGEYAPWFHLKSDTSYIVDWQRTIAYMAAPGSYGINVNLKGRQVMGVVEPEAYEDVRTKLIECLEQVKEPFTNEKLFTNILRREEVYYGNALEQAPDLLLIPKSYGTMVHHSITNGMIFGSPEHNGMHRKEGIFMLYGNQVKNCEMGGDVEDIAPTILNYFHIRKPAYMDGNPIYTFCKAEELKDIKETISLGQKESEEYDANEKKTAEEKLRTLGYL